VAERFTLPRSSLKLLRLILIGYLHEGGDDRKPAGPGAVGATVGLDPTLVSRNNAALAALGLLESAEARQWRLTDGGVTVARAFEYDADDEVRDALAEILRPNDFVGRVVAFVRSRGGVDEEGLISHMARTAGVKKTSEFLTGSRAVLELLNLAGLVETDGDMVRVPSTRREVETAEGGRRLQLEQAYSPGIARWDLASERKAPLVTLHMNVTPSDLETDEAADELAARIKRLLDALA
jgi:hypothetical protein